MSVRLRGRLDSVTNQDVDAVNPSANCSDDVCSPERTEGTRKGTNLPRDSDNNIKVNASLSSEARMASIDLQASYFVPDKYLLGSNLNNI